MNLVPFSSATPPQTWVSFGAQPFKIDAVLEMHRKNADAVVRATYVVWDGLNRMAQRQGELFAATVSDHAKVALDVFAPSSFEESASKQVGAVRDLYVSSVASLQEQSGIAVETNVTVGDILGTRVSEALDEFGVLFGKSGAAATVSGGADAAVVAEPAASIETAVVAEPDAGVEATVVGESTAGGEAAVAAEPAVSVDEATAIEVAAAADPVEAVPIVGPAAKPRPKKAPLSAKPTRRPVPRN